MSYNMSGMAAANNLYEVFAAVNVASGDLFGNFALLAIFIGVLSMTMMRQNPPPESFFLAGSVTAVASLVFVYVDLVGIVWFIGSTIIMAVSAIALYTTR